MATRPRTTAVPPYVVHVDGSRAVARPRDDGPCPVCDGRGTTTFRDEAGYEIHRPCACRQLARRLELFNRAGIEAHYADARLETFQPTNEDIGEAHAAAVEFVRRYPATTRGLLFSGPVGVGKTHLAVAVVRELTLERGVPSRFIDFLALIQELRASFERGGGAAALLERLATVELLVIDDLGKGRGNEWELEVLDDLVGRRYNAGATTIVTTNYRDATPTQGDRTADSFIHESLQQRVGTRIHSRLHEMCAFHDMEGRDFRRTRRSRGRRR